jgi:hypothetical protein
LVSVAYRPTRISGKFVCGDIAVAAAIMD